MSGTTINISVNNPSQTVLSEIFNILAGNPTGATTGTTSGTTGTTSGATSGTLTPPPVLGMPAGITGNAPVTIGTGSDVIVLQLCYGDPQAINAEFAVLFGGSQVGGIPVNTYPVAAGLTLTSTTYQGGGTPQVFTIYGNFQDLVGPVGPQVVVQGDGTTLNNISFQSVNYNFAPLVTQTTTDSRNTTNVNAESTWVSNGAPTVIWGEPVSASVGGGGTPGAEPTYTLTPSLIPGSSVSGTAQGAGNLSSLIALVPSGSTLTLPPGTFVGTSLVPVPMTISGSGPLMATPTSTPNASATVITCDTAAGLLEPTADKGIFVPQVPGVVFSNMTISGAVDNDNAGANASSIRGSNPLAGGAGTGFTIKGPLEICFCQDGILTTASTGSPPAVWNIDQLYVHDCGDNSAAGDPTTSEVGYTHALYFGGVPTDQVTITNSFIVGGSHTGHCLRTHAGTLVSSGNVYSSSTDTTGAAAGSMIDLPDGGLATFTNDIWILSALDANTIILQFGEGTNANLSIGQTITLNNVQIQAQGTAGGFLVAYPGNLPAATLVLNNCTYTGAQAPTIQGFVTVTGTFTKA